MVILINKNLHINMQRNKIQFKKKEEVDKKK